MCESYTIILKQHSCSRTFNGLIIYLLVWCEIKICFRDNNLWGLYGLFLLWRMGELMLNTTFLLNLMTFFGKIFLLFSTVRVIYIWSFIFLIQCAKVFYALVRKGTSTYYVLTMGGTGQGCYQRNAISLTLYAKR